MKVLLDVVKSLLLINGAVVLPSFLLVMALYKQQPTSVAVADSVSSKFHRDIQDDTPKYQQQLKELEAQKNQLQAKLEASQKIETVTSVIAKRPSVNKAPTQVAPVSNPQTRTVPSQPSVKAPVLARITTVSQTKTQPKPPQRSEVISPVSSPRKLEVTVARQEKRTQVVSEGNVEVKIPKIDSFVTDNQWSDQELAKATPKDFITLDRLKAAQTKRTEAPMIAPQATTPIKEHTTLANDLSVGLIVADQKGELRYGTKNYKKVQTAILSLRKGSSQTLEEAAQLSGIDEKTLQWLARYGRDRPGSFEPVAVSMVNPE